MDTGGSIDFVNATICHSTSRKELALFVGNRFFRFRVLSEDDKAVSTEIRGYELESSTLPFLTEVEQETRFIQAYDWRHDRIDSVTSVKYRGEVLEIGSHVDYLLNNSGDNVAQLSDIEKIHRMLGVQIVESLKAEMQAVSLPDNYSNLVFSVHSEWKYKAGSQTFKFFLVSRFMLNELDGFPTVSEFIFYGDLPSRSLLSSNQVDEASNCWFFQSLSDLEAAIPNLLGKGHGGQYFRAEELLTALRADAELLRSEMCFEYVKNTWNSG